MHTSETFYETFFRKAVEAILPFDQFVHTHTLAADLRADHLCYKCGTPEAFEGIRRRFELPGESTFMYQSFVNGRRIALIRMKRRVPTALGAVDLLELSDQKRDGSQTAGFDHIEAYPRRDLTVEDVAGWMKKRPGVRVDYVERPHHTTHDIFIDDGPFKLRLTDGPLMQKVFRTEVSP